MRNDLALSLAFFLMKKYDYIIQVVHRTSVTLANTPCSAFAFVNNLPPALVAMAERIDQVRVENPLLSVISSSDHVQLLSVFCLESARMVCSNESTIGQIE